MQGFSFSFHLGISLSLPNSCHTFFLPMAEDADWLGAQQNKFIVDTEGATSVTLVCKTFRSI